MVEKVIEVKNKLGIHARPAALLVRAAAKFASDIFLITDDEKINGKSIMSVMALAAEQGTKIRIQANGKDEAAAVKKMVELFENKFEED